MEEETVSSNLLIKIASLKASNLSERKEERANPKSFPLYLPLYLIKHTPVEGEFQFDLD